MRVFFMLLSAPPARNLSLHEQYPNWIICFVPHKLPQSGFDSMDPDTEKPAQGRFFCVWVPQSVTLLEPPSTNSIIQHLLRKRPYWKSSGSIVLLERTGLNH